MATIRDVASEAGVSAATVSRVMNSPEKVARQTQDRVAAAVAKLQFSPSAVAAELSRLHGRKKRHLRSWTEAESRSESYSRRMTSHQQIQMLKRENRDLKRTIRQFRRYLNDRSKVAV
ncbi:MAG: LacI family DNA-binding transcriptional regulator [Acidobacteria bacterium]|nr:LacI family DNA-binding transcriptional regulator [Acidobacteriota bacterium]